MTPAQAAASWFDQVQKVAFFDDLGFVLSADRCRQMAGALRRMESSPELEPLIQLFAAQCDLLAVLDQNLETATGGA